MQRSRLQWFVKLLTHWHTLLLVGIGITSCYLAIEHGFQIRQNMMVFSLIISFPLAFSLQSAFRRRDHALEHLSQLRASLMALQDTIAHTEKISSKAKASLLQLLNLREEVCYNMLRSGAGRGPELVRIFDPVQQLLLREHQGGSKALRQLGNHFKNLHEALTNLIAIKTHGTIVGVRVLSWVGISIFPIVQSGVLLDSFGASFPVWFIYFISIFTSVILGTLLQIQKQLEDPFDNDGLDDVRFELFRLPPARELQVQ